MLSDLPYTLHPNQTLGIAPPLVECKKHQGASTETFLKRKFPFPLRQQCEKEMGGQRAHNILIGQTVSPGSLSGQSALTDQIQGESLAKRPFATGQGQSNANWQIPKTRMKLLAKTTMSFAWPGTLGQSLWGHWDLLQKLTKHSKLPAGLPLGDITRQAPR